MSKGHLRLLLLLGLVTALVGIWHSWWGLMVLGWVLIILCGFLHIPDRVPGDDDSED